MPRKKKIEENKGILSQIKDKKVYTYTKLTEQELKELFSKLIKSSKEPRIIQMPAFDYDFLTDEEFISVIRSPHVKFIGGFEGIRKMRERAIKLGIL